MPSKVCGYARVSTARQAASGLSIDAQKAALEAYYHARYADTHAWGGVYQDPEQSGGKPFMDRPAGGKLLHRLDPGDILIVTRLDRAFRNTRDALITTDKLTKRKVVLIFLDMQFDTSTPLGQCVLAMLAAFAELERSFISERVRAALANKPRPKQREMYGWRKARIGHGYKPKLVPFPEMRELVAKLLVFRDGGSTYKEILTWCRQNKVYNPIGQTRLKTFELYALYRYLACEAYLQVLEGRRPGPLPELMARWSIPKVYPEGWEITYARYLAKRDAKEPDEAAGMNGQAH